MIFSISIVDSTKLTINEWGLGSDPISEKMHKERALICYKECLVELSVLIPKKKTENYFKNAFKIILEIGYLKKINK